MEFVRRSVDSSSEFAEQCAVIDWWALWARTRGVEPLALFSVPNGAHLAGNVSRRAIQARKLKSSGMRPGVPDLFLALPNQWFHGMFIAMKRRKGSVLSSDQVEYIRILRRQDYNVIVARGADEAIRAIQAYCEGVQHM